MSPTFAPPSTVPLKLDSWVSPPAYTGLPPVFLTNDQPQPIELVAGSRLLGKIQGAAEAQLFVDEAPTSFELFSRNALKIEQTIEAANSLSFEADGDPIGRWSVNVYPDLPPDVAFTAPPRKSERLNLQIDYEAKDDFGVETLTARITRITESDEAPLELEIFLPRTAEKEVLGSSYHDLTSHVWAGLAVEVQLLARDATGQESTNPAARIVLPERIFEHPIARAIIELRKQLTVKPEDHLGISAALEQLATRPDHFRHDILVALALNTASWAWLSVSCETCKKP